MISKKYSFHLIAIITLSILGHGHADGTVQKLKISEHNTDEGQEEAVHPLTHHPNWWGVWLSPFSLAHHWYDSPESPTYKIIADDTQFQLAYDVEGYDKEDIQVELKAGGHVLHISGELKSEDEGYKSVSKFHHNFAIDPKVMANEQISAGVTADGTLIVTVPKKQEHEKHYLGTRIPVQQLQGKMEKN